MLNEREILRYSRHISLGEIGRDGQEKLKAASVLVIGAGGLGCPVLLYLAAAGVGRIGIIDYDLVEMSNLQRQVLFDEQSVGKPKVDVAARRLREYNSLIQVCAINSKLTPANALDLFSQYDIIIDGSDNFSTRYLVNDACLITGKPLVYGSIYKFEGQVAVFNHQGGPSYRCLFPTPPDPGSVPSCSEIGVLGVLPGLIGCMQANEAIKVMVGTGEVLSGKLLLYNALNCSFSVLQVNRNEQVIRDVMERRAHFEQFDYSFFCGDGRKSVPEITVDELRTSLKAKDDLMLLDVREPHEKPVVPELPAINIPLGTLRDHVDELPSDRKVIVYCKSGIRSAQAIEILREEFGHHNMVNLQGGVMKWIATKTDKG